MRLPQWKWVRTSSQTQKIDQINYITVIVSCLSIGLLHISGQLAADVQNGLLLPDLLLIMTLASLSYFSNLLKGLARACIMSSAMFLTALLVLYGGGSAALAAALLVMGLCMNVAYVNFRYLASVWAIANLILLVFCTYTYVFSLLGLGIEPHPGLLLSLFIFVNITFATLGGLIHSIGRFWKPSESSCEPGLSSPGPEARVTAAGKTDLMSLAASGMSWRDFLSAACRLKPELSVIMHQVQDEIQSVSDFKQEGIPDVWPGPDYTRQVSDDLNGISQQIQTNLDDVETMDKKFRHIGNLVEQSSEELQSLQEQMATVESVLGNIQRLAERSSYIAFEASLQAIQSVDTPIGFSVAAEPLRHISMQGSAGVRNISIMTEEIQSRVDALSEQIELSERIIDEGIKTLKQIIPDYANLITSYQEEQNCLQRELNLISLCNDFNRGLMDIEQESEDSPPAESYENSVPMPSLEPDPGLKMKLEPEPATGSEHAPAPATKSTPRPEPESVPATMPAAPSKQAAASPLASAAKPEPIPAPSSATAPNPEPVSAPSSATGPKSAPGPAATAGSKPEVEPDDANPVKSPVQWAPAQVGAPH